MSSDPLRLKGPCDSCPFRTDDGFGKHLGESLQHERREEIANDLRQGSVFHCHKTVNYSESDDGEPDRGSAFCGGALVVMEKEGVPNGAKQIAERLGLLDPAQLKIDAPVHGTLQEFIEKGER